MGRKCTRPGEYIYICTALLICFVIVGCAASVGTVETQTTQKDVARSRLLKTDNSQGDQKNLLSSEKMSSDEDLFNTGISYSDPGNPARDYNKSLTTFKTLITEYPKSTWAYRGHVISDLLQENTKLKKQGTDLLQENTKLKEIIEQSKKVDIEIQQKKRE